MAQNSDPAPVSAARTAHTLDLKLLGQFNVTQGDQSVIPIHAPRLQALLAYLVLHRDAPQSRQHLAFLLFPDSSEAQARTNLRKLIHHLREALPDADTFLFSDVQTLQWNPTSSFTLDVAFFERAIADASSATALREAVELYRGELLPGCYDDWLVAERERLHQKYVETLERLILLLENQRDYRAAISHAEQLLRTDPLREETYRHLMRLYHAGGDDAGALRVYQTCVTVLQRELDAEPSLETRAEMERLNRKEAGLPPDLLSGTTTLLFTDIEGSTLLLQRTGKLYAGILQQHAQILRSAIARWHGRVIDTQGDSFFASFARATDAIAAAIEAQRALAKHPWDDGNTVRVRMGIHTGEPQRVGNDYVGLDVHRAARIGAAGHGGQTLISETTRALVEHELPTGVHLKDLGEHGLKDLPHPEHLFQVLAADLPADFPPLKSVHAASHNLPSQLTSFIGRTQQIADLKRLLSLQNVTTRTRLVTLTGAGGSGKTRLAIQVAHDVLPSFQEGIWFVDLSPLVDPTLIPQTIAAALGVHEQPGRLWLDTLLDYFRGKELLLILDNCEQFVAACAELVQTLLANCPHLQILATSRERLNLAGETVWLVPTLSLPDADQTWNEARHSEAVHLFVERAASALPTFALTQQNAPTVAQICRRLDGIPLAIELAAARIKVLTPAQIAERLEDAFRLLTRGSQVAPPRQQTLRAAMDWGYELLSVQEQILFRRLSVFAGGFTLESAEQVCAGGNDGNTIAADEILDLLSDLVDKSLVVVAAWEEGQQVRYRMLEPVRQYAGEKLSEARENDETRDCHFEHFLVLANQTKTISPAQAPALYNRLEVEHDNLRVALGWADGQKMSELLLELCAALGDFWERRGHWTESAIWFEHALTKSRLAQVLGPITMKHREAFAAVLLTDGHRALEQGEYASAHERLQEGLGIAQALDDKPQIAAANFSLGVLYWYQGKSEIAQSYMENYLTHARWQGDSLRIPHALWILSVFARERGDYAQARVLSEESLQRYRHQHERVIIGWVLENLGCVAILEGAFDEANALFEESFEVHKAADSKFGLAALLMNSGFLSWYKTEYGIARNRFEEALALYRDLGTSGFMLSRCLSGVAAVDAAEGALERAAKLLGAIRAEVERTGTRFTDIYLHVYDLTHAAARTKLDEGTFSRAWAEGRAMTLEQAVQFALEQT